MTAGIGLPAMLPEGFLVGQVVLGSEYIRELRIHVGAVGAAAALAVADEFLSGLEGLAHVFVGAVFLGLQVSLGQESQGGLLGGRGAGGVGALVEPFGSKLKVGKYHLLVDFQRLGALGCIVGGGGGLGDHGDGTELLNGIEIVHGAHEAGKGYLQVAFGLRLEGHLVGL